MLTEAEFNRWCNERGFHDKTVQHIQHIRKAPPARRVRSGRGNVPCWYPSRKMRVTLQAESHKNELVRVVEWDNNETTYETYDQPLPFVLRYKRADGRTISFPYTADFFLIEKDGAGYVECKKERELEELTIKYPERYMKDVDGRWRCPPGEQHAAQFGLFFRVLSDADINWVHHRNLLFLQTYYRIENPHVSETARAAIFSCLASEPGISLVDLLRAVGNQATADEIYTLLILREIYIDLKKVPLAEPGRVHVFDTESTSRMYLGTGSIAKLEVPGYPPPVTLEIGAKVIWDGKPFRIKNTGDTAVWMECETGKVIEVQFSALNELIACGTLKGLPDEGARKPDPVTEKMENATPKQLEEANRRMKIIRPRLDGLHTRDCDGAERSVARYMSLYREAELAYGNGYVGLIPKKRKGNPFPRFDEICYTKMKDVIKDNYMQSEQPNVAEAHRELERRCEEEGIHCLSYKSLLKKVNEEPLYESALARKGPKGAYPFEPWYWELTMTVPRHGDRPFQVAHIDHTELPLDLKSSVTGKPLGSPWWTVMTDAYSRRILAQWLSFFRPSSVSCMMVIRECVRRHRRLPESIVFDGGAEFDSVYLETLLARYYVAKKTRPKSKARFGSTCERIFGTTKTELVNCLKGNKQMMENIRQMTRGLTPQDLSVWTLGTFAWALAHYVYEIRDQMEHPALGQSSREAFESAKAWSGERKNMDIKYDEQFLIDTMPATPRKVSKVYPGCGMKIFHKHYWSDAFRSAGVENTSVPSRFDPEDAGVAKALVNGRWENCISEQYAVFKGRSTREVAIATQELRQQYGTSGRRKRITGALLANFISSAKQLEGLLALNAERLREERDKKTVMALEWPLDLARLALSASTAQGNLPATPVHEPHSEEVPKSTDRQEPLVVYSRY